MRRQYQMEDALIIGNVGRFCEQKNPKFLLKIFEELLKICPNACLLMIGQGELEEELLRLADSMKIRNRLIHVAATAHIKEFLCMMDVFVLPSLYEGLPVVVVEAQACGLPCVFSNSMTRQLKLTAQSNFLSLRRSPKEWATFIAGVAKRIPENRAAYAEKVKAAGYDIKDTAKWLEEFYLQL